MIEREYDKAMYSQSDDFKENVEDVVKKIVTLFEEVSWISLA